MNADEARIRIDEWLAAHVAVGQRFDWAGCHGPSGKFSTRGLWRNDDPESGCFIVQLQKQKPDEVDAMAADGWCYKLVQTNNATEGDPAAIRAELHRHYPFLDTVPRGNPQLQLSEAER